MSSTAAGRPWEPLFPPPSSGAASLPFRLRLLRRWGQPLLLLPQYSRCARTGLDLYSAQTRKARLVQSVLRIGLRVGIAPGLEPVTVHVDANAPLVRFLAHNEPTELLNFALLLGNPNAPGRRFIFLVMDRAGRPLRVAKTGTNRVAVELIRREAAFLKSLPSDRLHAPSVLGEFDSGAVAALSLEYAPGKAPQKTDSHTLGLILTSWLNGSAPAAFASLTVAERLLESPTMSVNERAVLTRLGQRSMATAIHHGDFAPWNIREHPRTGHWTVLDWERGEPAGPPAWDWFHYLIQPAVLVERQPAEVVLARVDGVMRTSDFAAYSRAVGMAGAAEELLLAYLLHCRDVIRQAEGMPTIKRMAELMTQRLAATAPAR